MTDEQFMLRAMELALEAERQGNPPVGAVIVLDGRIIAEGFSTLAFPEYIPSRHAEMNALDNVDVSLWPRAKEMTCYTTLEPCCMCYGRLLLSELGRIVFGAYDTEGGSHYIVPHLPPFYSQNHVPAMEGPIMPGACNELYLRTRDLFKQVTGTL
jgi:tRNA(adenine34) deaminase